MQTSKTICRSNIALKHWFLLAAIASLLPQLLFASSFGDSLVVVYTGGMRGRAEGCGCSSGPQGGLDRRTTLLKQSLGDSPYFALDCGGILDLDPDGGTARSRCTISGLAREGLKAISVSSRDLFYGTKFLENLAKEAGVTLLSLNIVSTTGLRRTLYERWMTIDAAGKKIMVTGLTMPVQTRSGLEQGSWIALSPDSIPSLLDTSRIADASLVILLTDLDEASLRRFLLSTSVFDIAITSSQQVYSATPFRVRDCLVLHPDNDGRSFEAIIIPANGDVFNSRFLHQSVTRTTASDPTTAAFLKECMAKSPAK